MIYFAQSLDGGPVKIGFTDNLKLRHKQLESHYGVPLAILATLDGDLDYERELHERFAHLRLGLTEQFQPAFELMNFIGRPLLVGLNPEAVEAIEPDPSKHKETVAVKCRAPFKAWVERLAKADDRSVPLVIERALKQYAQKIGFKEPPER